MGSGAHKNPNGMCCIFTCLFYRTLSMTDHGHGRDRERSRSPIPRKQKCAECKKTFSSAAILRRHVEEQHLHTKERYACPYCPIKFSRKHDLDRHWSNAHKDQSAPTAEEVPRTPGRDLDTLSLHPNSPIPLVTPNPRPPLRDTAATKSNTFGVPLPHVPLLLQHPPPSMMMMTQTSPPPVQRMVMTQNDRPPPCRQDAAVQTSAPARALKERVVKELMDGNTVHARVVHEWFFNE